MAAEKAADSAGAAGSAGWSGQSAKADAPWRWAWRSASTWSRGSAGSAKAIRPAASGRSQPSARSRLARSAVSATSRLCGSRPISAHSGGRPWRVEGHHQALARIDFRRGAIGFQQKPVMTGESREIERRAARPDFAGQAGHDRGPSRHRLQVEGDAVGHGVLGHVGIEGSDVLRADRCRGGVDGQVRVDFDPCSAAQLPAHARQQIGPERPERGRKEDVAQRRAGRRERGIGMDHHGIGAELAHVLDEMAKCFILRCSAHRGHGIEPEAGDAPGPGLRGIEAQIVGDLAQAGIARREIAVNGEQVGRIGGLGLEREGEAETELLGDLEAGSRIAAIGPHHGARCAAKIGRELVARAGKVGADARGVLAVVLVAPTRPASGVYGEPAPPCKRCGAMRAPISAPAISPPSESAVATSPRRRPESAPSATIAAATQSTRVIEDGWSAVDVVARRVCTKQCGRLDRWQGWWALVPGEAGAMRRVQAPSRGGVNCSINHLALFGRCDLLPCRRYTAARTGA